MRRLERAIDDRTMIAYGHYGRPVLAIPPAGGQAADFEEHGVVGAVEWLLDAGRLKLYCVDAPPDGDAPAGDVQDYEAWIRNAVVSWIADDCGGELEIATLGCGTGADRAVLMALQHAHIFGLAIGLDGGYHDPRVSAALTGGHLDWLRERVAVVLVAGGAEAAAGQDARELAAALRAGGVRCELDVRGDEHEAGWPAWCRRIAEHLPGRC